MQDRTGGSCNRHKGSAASLCSVHCATDARALHACAVPVWHVGGRAEVLCPCCQLLSGLHRALPLSLAHLGNEVLLAHLEAIFWDHPVRLPEPLRSDDGLLFSELLGLLVAGGGRLVHELRATDHLCMRWVQGQWGAVAWPMRSTHACHGAVHAAAVFQSAHSPCAHTV